jgi:O-acetyl-ADP-ribose deacetylase (regulator of RNase III)
MEGPQTLATRTVGNIHLEAVEGDITDLEVDAVVNAANDHLWMGDGVAGAIKRRGGEEIEREAVSKGPVPVGSAVATGGGALRAGYVIHGAVMGQDLRSDLATVALTTRSVFELALEMGLESLALPLFGTGVGGLGQDEVARVMVEEVTSMAKDGKVHLHILLVGYGGEAGDAIRRAVEGL